MQHLALLCPVTLGPRAGMIPQALLPLQHGVEDSRAMHRGRLRLRLPVPPAEGARIKQGHVDHIVEIPIRRRFLAKPILEVPVGPQTAFGLDFMDRSCSCLENLATSFS